MGREREGGSQRREEEKKIKGVLFPRLRMESVTTVTKGSVMRARSSASASSASSASRVCAFSVRSNPVGLSVSSRNNRSRSKRSQLPLSALKTKGVFISAKPASESSQPQVSKQLPTVEEQRQAARKMIAYFQEKRMEEEYQQNQQLGWVPKAEIANGRWVMFGLLVGMLTEYATGVNFIEQIKLLLVNLSIVDFD